ncbi:type VI secretion system Vgr family protein [Enterovibrio coralii]|uniref:Type IV secretion protein Rhs n=1 Tax=Enterovibrio coralii TaxID=294935 RepID=A0A135IDG4_9GAMM|nr:type VI secretion system tip protein TssI/VgrG [Enterovibrio coralii]KXF83502.1 type IV secretion protein Rhs [Enterovibrio coralii]
MGSAYEVSVRPITATVDGKGPYIVTSLSMDSRLSEACTLRASIASDEQITEKALGKTLSCAITTPNESSKLLALVTDIVFESYSDEKEIYYYTVKAADPLSLLQYRRNRKIYQSMTTKQIIESVLNDAGIKSYVKISVSGSGTTHEYCTQLDETDLAFVQRLLSFEGWHYHFDHSGSAPSVAVGDTNQAFKTVSNDKFTFQTPNPEPSREVPFWQTRTRANTSSISLADHSASIAEAISSGAQKSSSTASVSTLTAYHYGQGFSDKSVIRDAAKKQMESQDALKIISNGSSKATPLCAGHKFTLSEHPVSSCNQEYLVISISASYSGGEGTQPYECNNSFECIPSKTTFRPAFIDKPRIFSVQTASVTGPSNEEIYKDKSGQIKVQFHWDLDGKNDENTSCWLPVVQGTASNGFGMQFIPRIGDEVLVSYIEGDPDRPVVSGSIYNTKNVPPYSAATQSGIKTRSTPKGSSKNGNELRFEDAKDKEQVFLHAEKDLMVEVLNDATRTVTGKEALTVEKTIDISSKEAHTLKTDDKYTASAKADMSLSSDKNVKVDAGSNAEISASSKVSVDGQTVEIKGSTKISLAVGSSKIEISNSGIKINAPQVSINGSGKAELKGAMVTVEGSGKADIKGAMVSINGSAMAEVKGGAMVQIQGAIAKVN